jgi:multicomponent Na+:H+ antiporter subunit D
MTIAAVLCLAIGIYPKMLYRLLPFAVDFNPYDLTHVLAQTQLLFFAILAFVWLNLQGVYPPEKVAINLDAEWFYRRFLRRVVEHVSGWITQLNKSIRALSLDRVDWLITYLAQRHYPTGKGAVIRPTGNMVLYIAILLATYLWLLLSFPH